MKSNADIYSIQIHPDSNGLLHIETVVSSGIYNFVILGISHKSASDVKSRVYTALRTEGLLNLKSDNRKITVNLISDTLDIISPTCELGIALSCISCISNTLLSEKILAVGGLSITGNIIPTNRIMQALYISMTHGIKHIVCSYQDIKAMPVEYLIFAETIGIRFIVGYSLREIVDNIKNYTFYTIDKAPLLSDKPAVLFDPGLIVDTLKTQQVVWAFFISLCGKHDLMIETNKSIFFDDLITFGEGVIPPHHIAYILSTVNNFKMTDTSVGEELQYKIYTPDKNANNLSHLSFIQDGVVAAEEIENEYYENTLPKVVTCYICPCGQTQKRCVCIQRSILKHRNKLNTEHKPVFHMWVEQMEAISCLYTKTDIQQLGDLLNKVQIKQFDRFCKEQDIQTSERTVFTSYDFCNRNRKIEQIIPYLSPEALETYDHLSAILNSQSKANVLQIAQTLQDIEDCTYNTKGEISKETLLLAFSYIPRTDS